MIRTSPMLTTYENLSKYYTYDYTHASVRNKRTGRQLQPDDTLQVFVYDSAEKTKARIKYNKLCWILGTKEDFPAGFKILHVNMDVLDFRIRNMRLVTPSEYNLIQEAKRNLSGTLTMVAHPEDAYSMQVRYVMNGKHITETIHDVIFAKRRYAALQLRFAKVLSRYCNIEV